MIHVELQSYARSGSNFLLTLLHDHYKCEVVDLGSIAYDINMFEEDSNKALKLYKSHNANVENMNKFIMLLRSPLECIPRHCEWDINLKGMKGTKFENEKLEEYTKIYKEFLQKYDEIKISKINVYYEDLINDPFSTIDSIVNFIDVPLKSPISIRPELVEKSAKMHRFVDKANTNLKKHQIGMPDNVYQYIKNELKHPLMRRYFYDN